MLFNYQSKVPGNFSTPVLALNGTASNIFISVFVFATLVVIIIYGSNLVLKYGDKEIKITSPPAIDMTHVRTGAGGINEMVGPDDNLHFKPAKISELTRDGILTEVDQEGRLKGYITMESFLKGCFNGECRPLTLIDDPMPKTKIYIDHGDKIVLEETLLSVAVKMVSQNASALPVLDHRGRAVGSITYREVLSLFIQEHQNKERKNNNR